MSNLKKPPLDKGTLSVQGSLFPGMMGNEGGDETAAGYKKRKLQIANGYLLELDNISRILNICRNPGPTDLSGGIPGKRINRAFIAGATGLADRAVEAYVSMAVAMDLLLPVTQTLTPLGVLVAEFDPFFERPGTLQWCHYRGAGSVRNLVWFDIFNLLLRQEKPMTRPEWHAWYRVRLNGLYSARTLQKVVPEEVHFITDAYLERKFKKLDILEKDTYGVITQKRYRRIDHLVFTAMLYDFISARGGGTMEIMELERLLGSPAVVFALDADSLRVILEALHAEGLVRYETAHNLDQVRLIPGYKSADFLRACLEEQKPCRQDETRGVHG